MKKIKKIGVVLMALSIMTSCMTIDVYAANQSKPKNVQGGTLYSNVWRSNNPSKSGTTYQWDYQVSAKYVGNVKVQEIRTTWRVSASLRSGSSISMGLGGGATVSATAGTSSSWQTVSTASRYWSNTNGAKESSWRSNAIVAPRTDYRKNTFSVINEARVKLKGNKKPYTISAGV
jgi:hypothetical protein